WGSSARWPSSARQWLSAVRASIAVAWPTSSPRVAGSVAWSFWPSSSATTSATTCSFSVVDWVTRTLLGAVEPGRDGGLDRPSGAFAGPLSGPAHGVLERNGLRGVRGRAGPGKNGAPRGNPRGGAARRDGAQRAGA